MDSCRIADVSIILRPLHVFDLTNEIDSIDLQVTLQRQIVCCNVSFVLIGYIEFNIAVIGSWSPFQNRSNESSIWNTASESDIVWFQATAVVAQCSILAHVRNTMRNRFWNLKFYWFWEINVLNNGNKFKIKCNILKRQGKSHKMLLDNCYN